MRAPPIAEQRRIVAKVDELMALADVLETQLGTARTTASALLAAALGELTNSPNAIPLSSKKQRNHASLRNHSGRVSLS